MMEVKRTNPMIEAESNVVIARVDQDPSPGQANIVSVRTAPESRPPNIIPTTVVVGINALRLACFFRTTFYGNPLDRAVFT